MSREIKFRAFSAKNNKMFYGADVDLFQSKEGLGARVRPIVSADYDCDVQLMQFTGLKDKNGVDIYDGDVVLDKELGKGVVVFQSGCFFMMYDAETTMEFLGLQEDKFGRLQVKRIVEVIGNIYQNPELLTNKKQQDEPRT